MLHPRLAALAAEFTPTGDVESDVAEFLTARNHAATASHCAAVAAQAAEIADRFGMDVAQANAAGWLHDVSAVISSRERLAWARDLGIDVLPEEEQHPLLLHQKLSVVLAEELFGMHERTVLDAIGCHTTLRPGSTPLDRALFVADKLSWDREGEPPYRDQVRAALERSLDDAAALMLRLLWEVRAEMKVVHPWLRAAYEELNPGAV